uniref:Secreted SPRY domain-containing protein 1 n=1 Tax=Globodera rostochiensis TaxID=31243 RepID=A0A914HDT4_GLORO
MRFFHFLDAVCLFVVAAFILLETDAQPKKSTSNTKLKNKGPTSSGNAKPNADALPKTTTSNTKLENEPAKQKNSGLTLGNRWDSVASDEGLKLSEPDQLIVEYPGQNYGAQSVSAEQPIPKIKSGFFYYEVEILARKAYRNAISIGLGHTKGIPTKTEIGRSEGYAYDSDGRFWGHKVKESYDFYGRPCIDGKPKFAVRNVVNGVAVVSRNVVGCGVNLKTGQIIYTQNGVLLSTTGLLVDLDADLFPTVSLGCPGYKIEANFGSKKFKFDRANVF